MSTLTKIIKFIDRVVIILGATLTGIMVLLVFYEVIGRYGLKHVPSWTQEIVLVVMMWFGFLSIAIGFRFQLHIKLTMFIEKLPQKIQTFCAKVSDVLIVAFGVILLVEGTKFTVFTWDSTLPVTKLPTGIQYIIVPVAGFLTIIYGLLWLFGWKEDGNKS